MSGEPFSPATEEKRISISVSSPGCRKAALVYLETSSEVLKPAECAAALGVHDALRDTLAVELRELFDQVAIGQDDRAVGADGLRMRVGRDASTWTGWLKWQSLVLLFSIYCEDVRKAFVGLRRPIPRCRHRKIVLFQMGTRALIRSTSCEQTSNAWPRWAADTAQTSAGSPTSSIADAVGGPDADRLSVFPACSATSSATTSAKT